MSENQSQNAGFSKTALIIGIVLISTLGGGLGSWLVFSKGSPGNESTVVADAAAESTDPIANAIQNGGAFPLEPFLVNLADADAARYLRIKVSLMIADKTGVKELSENVALQMKARDLIVQTLTQKTSGELMSEAGKQALRQEIRERIEDYFRKSKLVDVMFTDFVIQL